VTAAVVPAEGAARVLIVEDDPAQARLVQLLVTAAGYTCLGVAAGAAAAAQQAAQADVVLVDYRLEGTSTGLDLLREIRARELPVAVIVMTGHGSERVAAEALHLGANDYVIKDESFAQLLPEVVGRVVRVREIERALEAAQQSLIRAERRAAIGEIVVALSHEINSPLMALSAQIDLLRLDQAAFPPAARAALEGARQQLARIAELLERLRRVDHDETTTYVGGTRMTDLSGAAGGDGRD
jgi:DNA-binding response OmpR family regulator